MEERYIKMLEDGKRKQDIALSLTKYQINYKIGRASILSAREEGNRILSVTILKGCPFSILHMEKTICD
ncbi:unnamed protein product [Dovyalis caffra]|uniref:Uncharacterized protein n=1 Tax=Dovyalis caffra TaxID=77055 RepID=A0AAV1RK80_9ROSI|nr:unnamed protein product [Dovyalis caffra]